jgi:glycosyltransferase involved in cell wall biosynthesis
MEWGGGGQAAGMRILIVSFQPEKKIDYPHLKQVTEMLAENTADHALFRERGYFLADRLKLSLSGKGLLQAISALAGIVIDSAKLAARRVLRKYDVVIAVDNFAFVISSLLFKRVILWSHDFVTQDQPRSEHWAQRWLRRMVIDRFSMTRDIIIQDSKRLELFCSNYMKGNRQTVNTFFLPVSLKPSSYWPRAVVENRPLLLQIGGINAWRSMSDEILEYYQSYHDCFELAFHGFFDRVMIEKISGVRFIPWVSMIPLDANAIFKAVEKSDIGFIAYRPSDMNFHFISRASGQLVEFIRCGKPVIVLGDTDLKELVQEKEIGVAISRIADLGEAIRYIMKDYHRISANCRQLFDAEYCLNSYWPSLGEWISRVALK